ncbi:MAG: hypothetical protein WCC17_03455 [Candidatus Nitrosopolaris sp.]
MTFPILRREKAIHPSKSHLRSGGSGASAYITKISRKLKMFMYQ